MTITKITTPMEEFKIESRNDAIVSFIKTKDSVEIKVDNRGKDFEWFSVYTGDIKQGDC